MQPKVQITASQLVDDITISSTRKKTKCELDQILTCTVITLNNHGIYYYIEEADRDYRESQCE